MKDRLLQWYERHSDADTRSREGYGAFAGFVGLLCNVLLVVVKIGVGLFSGSLSVIADAMNNLSDAASSVVTLVGFRFSKKPADAEHPFGHARIEYLSGAFIAVVMVLVGVELLRTSAGKILNPTPVSFSVATLLLLVLAVLVKGWMRSFYRFVGGRIESSALSVAADDSRNDVIATSVVLLGALLQYLFGLQLDGWLGAAVALFIIFSGLLSLKEMLDPLLGEAPPPALVQQLTRDILAYPGVLGLHDLVVHTYGPVNRFATVHVEMSSRTAPQESHGVIDRIERELGKKYNLSLVVHYDPVDPPSGETERLAAQIQNIVQAIDPGLTFHDLRTAYTASHTNVIFDLALPPGSKWKPAALKERVGAEIRNLNPSYHPVIQVDRNYTSYPSD